MPLPAMFPFLSSLLGSGGAAAGAAGSGAGLSSFGSSLFPPGVGAPGAGLTPATAPAPPAPPGGVGIGKFLQGSALGNTEGFSPLQQMLSKTQFGFANDNFAFGFGGPRGGDSGELERLRREFGAGGSGREGGLRVIQPGGAPINDEIVSDEQPSAFGFGGGFGGFGGLGRTDGFGTAAPSPFSPGSFDLNNPRPFGL